MRKVQPWNKLLKFVWADQNTVWSWTWSHDRDTWDTLIVSQESIALRLRDACSKAETVKGGKVIQDDKFVENSLQKQGTRMRPHKTTTSSSCRILSTGRRQCCLQTPLSGAFLLFPRILHLYPSSRNFNNDLSLFLLPLSPQPFCLQQSVFIFLSCSVFIRLHDCTKHRSVFFYSDYIVRHSVNPFYSSHFYPYSRF